MIFEGLPLISRVRASAFQFRPRGGRAGGWPHHPSGGTLPPPWRTQSARVVVRKTPRRGEQVHRFQQARLACSIATQNKMRAPERSPGAGFEVAKIGGVESGQQATSARPTAERERWVLTVRSASA